MKYAKLYANANDTANIRNSANEVSRVQALYDYSSYQQDALENSRKVTRLWCILFSSLVAVVVIACVSYLFHKRYKGKMFSELRELNSKYVQTLRAYHDAVAEYDKVNTEKSVSENKQDDNIENLEKELSTYQDGFDISKLIQEKELQNYQIVAIMHSHASKLTLPTVAEWSALIDVAGYHIPNVLASLESTSVPLTENELRVCILTRICFIPSEIAVLLNMTKQNVINLRSSLNKKYLTK